MQKNHHGRAAQQSFQTFGDEIKKKKERKKSVSDDKEWLSELSELSLATGRCQLSCLPFSVFFHLLCLSNLGLNSQITFNFIMGNLMEALTNDRIILYLLIKQTREGYTR